jgi:hypothetical protein
MKHVNNFLLLSFLLLGIAHAVDAQTGSPKLQIAVETDLVYYISLGGFSIWGTHEV